MTIRLRAYKTELDPNDALRTLLLKHAGARRWAFNWGLRRKIEDYERTGKSPSAQALHRELNALKKAPPDQGGVPWMYEVSKCAPQEALRDLDKAFQNFFRRVKNGEKPGFPRYKSKKKGIGGFRLTGTIRVFERHVQLPRLGRIRLKERGYLPLDNPEVRILSATVSERSGRWYVSLQVEEEVLPREPSPETGGVDVGISDSSSKRPVSSVISVSRRTEGALPFLRPKPLPRLSGEAKERKQTMKIRVREPCGQSLTPVVLYQLRATVSVPSTAG
jgi:putative transposase